MFVTWLISLIETCFGFFPSRTRAPPELTTISLPCATAERTATTCGQPFGLESATRCAGGPKVSRRGFLRDSVRTTFPCGVISRRPGNARRRDFRAGRERYE